VAQLSTLGIITRMKRVYTVSPRAKKVLYPAYAVFIFTWLSFVVHLIYLGTSGIPGGKVRIVDGKYMIDEHGTVITLSATQYWFSYVHVVILFAVTVILLILCIVFACRGDMKYEHRDA